MQAVVEEATKTAAPVLLLHVVSAAIANPAAAVLGAVAKSFIAELLKQTSASTRYLEQIVEEPLKTATAVVTRVLSAPLSKQDELREADRQLKGAYDNLQKALSYAPDGSGDKRLVIGFYQAFVAALMTGGGAFVAVHVKELRALAARYRARSKEAANRAQDIRARLEKTSEIFRLQISQRPGVGGDRALEGLAISLPRARQESERDALEKEAAASIARAEQIERFCDFVTQLAQHQPDVLQSAAN